MMVGAFDSCNGLLGVTVPGRRAAAQQFMSRLRNTVMSCALSVMFLGLILPELVLASHSHVGEAGRILHGVYASALVLRTQKPTTRIAKRSPRSLGRFEERPACSIGYCRNALIGAIQTRTRAFVCIRRTLIKRELGIRSRTGVTNYFLSSEHSWRDSQEKPDQVANSAIHPRRDKVIEWTPNVLAFSCERT
jgi:hypothetical protein